MKFAFTVASLLTALVTTVVVLAYMPEKSTYATVHHKNGYTTVGVISSQTLFAETLVYRGSTLLVTLQADQLQAAEANEGFKEDLTLKAQVGIQFIGSAGMYRLVTSETIYKTDLANLLSQNIIGNRLAAAKTALSENLKGEADKAITYGPAPVVCPTK